MISLSLIAIYCKARKHTSDVFMWIVIIAASGDLDVFQTYIPCVASVSVGVWAFFVWPRGNWDESEHHFDRWMSIKSWVNVVFQNRGVCGQAYPFSPLPFHVFSLSSQSPKQRKKHKTSKPHGNACYAAYFYITCALLPRRSVHFKIAIKLKMVCEHAPKR